MIEDFQHICITCRDLEASTRFYELLGLEVVEPAHELDEKHLATAMKLPKGHINVLHLAPKNATSGMFIDLVQWLEPASDGQVYPALNNVGINRVAFRVSELEKIVAVLSAVRHSVSERESSSIWSHPDHRDTGPGRGYLFNFSNGLLSHTENAKRASCLNI